MACHKAVLICDRGCFLIPIRLHPFLSEYISKIYDTIHSRKFM